MADSSRGRPLDGDDIFDKFPELLFGDLKKRMLLGLVKAETVKSVMEPFLTDFWNIMLKLPLELERDLENILRIYPDVAESFSIRMKPPIEKALLALSINLRKRARQALPAGDGAEAALDLAAEGQSVLEEAGALFPAEGQGFFLTNKGNSVFVEFSYFEGDEYIAFGRKPVQMGIDLHLCEVYAVTFQPEESGKGLTVKYFLEICKENGTAKDKEGVAVFEIENTGR